MRLVLTIAIVLTNLTCQRYSEYGSGGRGRNKPSPRSCAHGGSYPPPICYVREKQQERTQRGDAGRWTPDPMILPRPAPAVKSEQPFASEPWPDLLTFVVLCVTIRDGSRDGIADCLQTSSETSQDARRFHTSLLPSYYAMGVDVEDA